MFVSSTLEVMLLFRCISTKWTNERFQLSCWVLSPFRNEDWLWSAKYSNFLVYVALQPPDWSHDPTW